MANGIPELRMRKETDRRLSFGIYLVIIVIMVALVIAVAASMGIYFWARGMPQQVQYAFDPDFDFGPWFGPDLIAWITGWILVMVVSGVIITVVFWWYQWQLYSRRNDHIERAKRLRVSLSRWLKEKHQIDLADPASSDMLLSVREQYRGTAFFVLWVILGYFVGFPVGFILTLVTWYWLTIDYAIHERGELEFFRGVSQKLKEKGISFDSEITYPLIPRNMALYVVLMIIPGVNIVWGIWWSYVLFRDPNRHFETHEHWESQLERIAGEPGPSATPDETPLGILKERYTKGEITKEDFERMKEDLSAE